MRLTDEQRMEVEYNRGEEAALSEVGGWAQRLYDFACHGDYSNGNVEFGTDEGQVMASKCLDQFEQELKALCKQRLPNHEEVSATASIQEEG